MWWYRISLFESGVCAARQFYLHVSEKLIYCLIIGQPEQPGLVEDAHGQGIGDGWSFRSLPTKTIPCVFLISSSINHLLKVWQCFKGTHSSVAGSFSGIIPCKGELLPAFLRVSRLWILIAHRKVLNMGKPWGKFALCCIWLPCFINVHSFWGAERIISNSSVRGIQSI